VDVRHLRRSHQTRLHKHHSAGGTTPGPRHPFRKIDRQEKIQVNEVIAASVVAVMAGMVIHAWWWK
jgi:hypothetical protein